MSNCGRADLRFDLPEGAYWRDVESADEPWLAQMHPDWRENAVGIKCQRYRLRDEREGSPTFGQERECVLDNAGGIVMAKGLQARGPDEIISGTAFYLTDGNLGCGCNRALEFARAGGDPEPEDRPCDAAITCTWPAWLVDVDDDPYSRNGNACVWCGADVRPWNKHECKEAP